MSLNTTIGQVQQLDNVLSTLQSVKGDVTNQQVTQLTSLFSMQLYNTSDSEGTKATLERQIKEMEMLLEEIEGQIAALYDENKDANQQLASLISNLNDNQYDVVSESKKAEQRQIDIVNSATDEAFNEYMKGEITKDEIPMYIAQCIKKSNNSGGAALQASLSAMDSTGQEITNLSNKIADILDSLNNYKAKYQTTEASKSLLTQLVAKMPKHKTRDDITTTPARPYFDPRQEALGDKLIDKFKVAASGADPHTSVNPALQNLTQAIQGSAAVDETRKAELDAMSPEEKAAAVEECDLAEYSALELMYMSGMDKTQAAYAIHHIFEGAAIGYNTENGEMSVPLGHDDGAAATYANLVNQYNTLWDANVSTTDEPSQSPTTVQRTDPIGWREGNTNFLFAVDRNKDNIFNDSSEFVGAENGWAELEAFDTNQDGTLTAAEAEAAGLMVVSVDQSLKNGGNYGFNSAAAEGFESLDLNSYKEVDELKQENLNGNLRIGEFSLKVDGQNILGKQTLDEQSYMDTFYGHMYGDAFTFGLDPNEVAKVLTDASDKEDYLTELQKDLLQKRAVATNESIDETKNVVNQNLENADNASSNINVATGLVDVVSNDEENETDSEQETETNTNDTTEPTISSVADTSSTVDNNIFIPKKQV